MYIVHVKGLIAYNFGDEFKKMYVAYTIYTLSRFLREIVNSARKSQVTKMKTVILALMIFLSLPSVNAQIHINQVI